MVAPWKVGLEEQSAFRGLCRGTTTGIGSSTDSAHIKLLSAFKGTLFQQVVLYIFHQSKKQFGLNKSIWCWKFTEQVWQDATAHVSPSWCLMKNLSIRFLLEFKEHWHKTKTRTGMYELHNTYRSQLLKCYWTRTTAANPLRILLDSHKQAGTQAKPILKRKGMHAQAPSPTQCYIRINSSSQPI